MQSTTQLTMVSQAPVGNVLQLEQTLQDAKGQIEFLAFTLGHEEYGVNIQKVQELRSYEHVTQIANTPAFFKGVVNLRGLIVPIIDLRIKFSGTDPSYDQFTVVIVIKVAGQVIGMVVDGVSDVTSLQPSEIKPVPAIGSAIDTDYLMGVGTLDGRMLQLIDVEKLMSANEIGLLAKHAA